MSIIKKTILYSIEQTKNKLGYTLISEDWGSSLDKCTCAMGCVLLADTDENADLLDDPSEAAEAAANILGVKQDWITSFIDGYDGNGTSKGAEVPEAWLMGQEVAAETKPITHAQFFELNDAS